MDVFALEGYVGLILTVAMLAVKIFAFVNSLLWPAEAYEAAGKLTKTTWSIILGLAVLLELIPIGLFFVSLALLIAALVYLADVRPALAGLRRR